MTAQRPLLNPFLAGKPVPPKRFVGRQDALRSIFGRISTGQSSAVTGAPHIGKSSFLQYIRDGQVRRAWLGATEGACAFVDVDCHMVPLSFGPEHFWSYLLDYVEREFPEQPVLAAAESARQNNLLSFALRSLFDLLSRAGKRVILLVDEFDVLLNHARFNTPDFFGALRSLSTSTDSLALVAASRMSTAEMNRRGLEITPLGSPFFNSLTEVQLTPLRPEEVDDLVARTLEGTGVVFTTKDRLYIGRVSGRHPFLVQLAAGAMFNAAAQGMAEAERFRMVYRTLQRDGRAHFEDMWRHLGPALQPPVRALALAELQGAAEVLQPYEPELHILADAGLIEPARPGSKQPLLAWRGERWRVAAASFARWVADHAGDAVPPPPQAPLRERLAAAFSLEEIRTLCADLGVEFEDLPGQTREARAQDLIEHCERRGLTHQLLARCRELRPHLTW
ncbi:MAG TPA: hypothetical protein VNL77_03065 [Roseiflexaceae bacterium]|nr:hypothetical protein [Roseiflexaceae bacterium]